MKTVNGSERLTLRIKKAYPKMDAKILDLITACLSSLTLPSMWRNKLQFFQSIIALKKSTKPRTETLSTNIQECRTRSKD